MDKHVALYVRVSTFDQAKSLQSQKNALTRYAKNHGFKNTKIYSDRMTGASLNRPGFEKLQKDVFAGCVDTIVVWKLDRLSRSLKDGIGCLTEWLEQGIRVISISQQFDFSGAVGKLISAVLFAVAEMERTHISENVRRGQELARQKGKSWGGSKPRLLSISKDQLRSVAELHRQGVPKARIARTCGINRTSVYRLLARLESGDLCVD